MNVGAYEAKTHLSELLERVSKGERIVITKHGVPVAVLQPPDTAANKGVEQVIEDMRSFRKELRARGVSLSHEEISEWTREGRD